MSTPPVASPELECGWCGRALELPRMPATLVAQCGFCKKALDLAPAVTALAPAAAPAPLEAMAEVTEENGVQIALWPDRVELTVQVGSVHPVTAFFCLATLTAGALPILAEWRPPLDWPLWLSAVAFLPTVYWIFWNVYGRWKVTLRPEGLTRENMDWAASTVFYSRQDVGQCELLEHVANEGRRGPRYHYDVELKIRSRDRFQTLIPRMLMQGQAWVVQREINQWLARTQKPPRGDR